MKEETASVQRHKERIARARRALAERHRQAPEAVQQYQVRMARLSAAAKRERADGGAARLWCIVQTSSGRTLALADALADAGFDVWTPRGLTTVRKGRSKAPRDRAFAVMPGLVFVDADRLADLAHILNAPVNPYPAFTIFHAAGRVPLIASQEIDGFRHAEQQADREWEHVLRARQKKQRHTVAVGTEIRMSEGPFAGMQGVVVDSNDKAAKVRFTLFGMLSEVEIASWLLLPDTVDGASPRKGTAARAA